MQGEANFAGMRAVFVRFAKCNLDCIFCDTFFDDGEWLTIREIAYRIVKVVTDYHKIAASDDYNTLQDVFEKTVLVMTGGEPMLQQNLFAFIEYMMDNLHFGAAQIESNGTVYQDLPEETVLVVSPKCSEKTGKYLKPNPKLIPRIDSLKFVVSSDEDSPYHTIPDWADNEATIVDGQIIDPLFTRLSDVYVSPMNVYNDIPRQSKELRLTSNQTTLEQRSEIDEVVSFWTEGLLNREVNQKNHEYAARYCMDKGFVLNLQMHLYASLA